MEDLTHLPDRELEHLAAIEETKIAPMNIYHAEINRRSFRTVLLRKPSETRKTPGKPRPPSHVPAKTRGEDGSI